MARELLRWITAFTTGTGLLVLACAAFAQTEGGASSPPVAPGDAATSASTTTGPAEPGAPVNGPAPGSPAAPEPWPVIEVTEVAEVTVRSESAASRLRHSAQAVGVVETERARQESADLGAVLQRTQGVGVRRSGGLGSSTQFSLNGFTEDQIRFFLDGVPLALAGFPQGIANVPVNLVKRVEIYRGVVPIRFGADALGGAVNIVTNTDDRGSQLGASYQVGSFGTHRATLSGRQRFDPLGFVVSLSGYLDRADNDYAVDVLVPSEAPETRGQLVPARVRRFHDRYRALGGSLDLGFVERPWAQRLMLRLFASGYDKDLQSNLTMTVPYGEVTFGESVRGATLRYEHPSLLPSGLGAELLLGYSQGTLTLLDRPGRAYDWFGRRTRETGPGELGPPSDLHFTERRVIGRMSLRQPLFDNQLLRLSVAPSFFTRDGENRFVDTGAGRDPLSVERQLISLVSGLEHTLVALDERLENTVFIKDYLYRAEGERQLAGGLFTPVERDTHRLAFGDAARLGLFDALWAKASYEYTNRLPDPDEVFGTGVTVAPNLELEPETSQNFNLGLLLELPPASPGSFRGELNGFYRNAEGMIVLLPSNALVSSYQNVHRARSLGVEGSFGWTSPGEYLFLDATATWMDFRNTAEDGPFAAFRDDRIPNHPWLFANTSARVQFSALAAADDELSLGWNARYVHSFYRGWESAGRREDKQIIQAQYLHSAVLNYVFRSAVTLTSSFEVDNLTNAKAFDFFGAQKPGRAFYFKATVEY